MINRRQIIQGIAATALVGLSVPSIASPVIIKNAKPRLRNWQDFVHNVKAYGPGNLAFYFDWDKDKATKKRAIVPQSHNGTLETIQDYRTIYGRELSYETAFYINRLFYTIGNLKDCHISAMMHRYFENFPVRGKTYGLITNMVADLEDGRKVHIYNRQNDIAMDGPMTVGYYEDNKWGVIRHPYWESYGYITT